MNPGEEKERTGAMFNLKENFQKNPHKIVYLPISDILPNPHQPRKNFEPQNLDGLCRSIKSYGILQPVCVRRIGKRYELISGERRIRAAHMAGYDKVPAIIYQITDEELAEYSLMENVQRENLSFFEESEGYNLLLNSRKMNQDGIACRLGKKRIFIENKVRLLRLSPKIRKIIQNHNLTEQHAKLLLRLNNEESQMKVLEKVIENDYDTQHTEELVDKLLLNEIPTLESNKSYCMKDLRVFTNTLKQTVDIMTRSGIKASSHQQDYDSHIEYTITIEKSDALN